MKTTTFLKSYFYQTLQIFIQRDVTNGKCNLKTADKKTHSFLVHREQQVGVSTNQQLLLNISKRGVITYYSINYFQHKNFYDFSDAEKIVDNFFRTFERSFVSNKKVKMYGYIELINYQPSEIIELESKRVWLTDVFTGRYFNKYIKVETKSNFLKRVIVNGAMDSSWQFKRFNRLSVIVTDIDEANSLISSNTEIMEFIELEASETDQQNEDLTFSDDENKDNSKVDDNFIDDSEQANEPDFSFYRRFANQTKDPRVAIYEESDGETFLDTRDFQPELYAVEDRERVVFDEFSGYEKSVVKFKKSLSSFSHSNNENSFLDAVIYGLMFKLTEGKIMSRDKVESVLGVDIYKDFCEAKNQLQFDTSLYGFFYKCALANELLTK